MKAESYITLLTLSILFIASFGISSVRAEEPALLSILNELGFTNLAEISVETFVPGTYNVTLYAEFADYHSSNELSWYIVNTSSYNVIFSGSEGNFGYVSPPITKQFTTEQKFGLSFFSGEGVRYYTETGRNPDGIEHAKIYVNLDNPDMYLIGFENLYGQTSDRDYNDMVISLELIMPPTINVNGVNWLFYNATNDKAMIYLDGGYAFSTAVNVFPYLQDKTPKESLFIHKMIWNGFDIITNADWFYYDGTQTAVKNVAEYLLGSYYKRVFLFGYSAGGVIVAYEIQKEYASTLFSAAVVASAPVNWDPRTAPIYQSADTAQKDKVATCLIAGVNDTITSPPIPDQMKVYYSNALIHKEWHNWTDGHDVFYHTCYDHPGEDIAMATLSWFNAAHPPNTPLKPSGPITVHRNEWFTYSTSTIDPNGDDIRYEVKVTGPNTNVTAIGEWHSSGEIDTWGVLWETNDSLGTYQMQVRAQDVNGLWSCWSSPLNITVVNRAPYTSSTPSGPTSGYTGASYSYSTSTTDPDGDDVCYQFDWGDGLTTTTGYYSSGSTVSVSHTWESSGTYYVKVRAKDVYGAWSDWSDPLTVTISSGGGGGGGGCPTLFSWNGTAFTKEALLDIHASQDVTVDYTLKHLTPIGRLCMLQLRELENFTSHIDYVKLYVVDSEGNWHECNLILAWHSQLGLVTTELFHDDNVRVDLTSQQKIQLIFLTPSDIDDIQSFVFELNGYNMKTPLLK